MSAPGFGPPVLPPGTRVGPWRVVARIGQGAYGTVYRVERHEPKDPSPFALKLANHPQDPRFEREVELLGRIHHSGVPRVQDAGWWKHPSELLFPYFVMEWVEGVPLYEWGAQRPVTSREVMKVLAQVARALEATHVVGGLHRDIKGDNVLVQAEGTTAVLTDFGAGTFRGARPLTWQALPPGTSEYRSPEANRFYWRWSPHSSAPYEAGQADDLYALGVMAYRLVTGTYPSSHVGGEASEGEDDSGWVPPQDRVTVCPELAALIRQLLSVEPMARGSAREVAETLEHAARKEGRGCDRPILARVPRTSPGRWPVALRIVFGRNSRRMAAAMGIPLVLGMVWVVANRVGEREPGREEAVRSGEDDGGAVGLGDAEELGQVPASKPALARPGIGLEMPKGPFPGQHRAPCKARYEEEIHGGCWVLLGKMKPPCGDDSYEWKGACYLASYPPERQPNSVKP
ncbi:serine/threonine protein kinase [Hyalangium rubrum]|uniref:Serine/threonine-protein kinase n=1 Tax=Hyalangium rubrum TaxID=3103134 RepID=A0ABU5H1J6_9BACT|nr:serine/threonine-protein kinase [Hyalangium sp. s54d21]MDY7227328.1 serine/threonine-protein kinase [Hyalangium sp. s54d21]